MLRKMSISMNNKDGEDRLTDPMALTVVFCGIFFKTSRSGESFRKPRSAGNTQSVKEISFESGPNRMLSESSV